MGNDANTPENKPYCPQCGRHLRDLEKVTTALRESEAKYRSLAEATPDIHFSMNSDGIVQYISPQVRKYGFSQAEFIGKPFFDKVEPQDQRPLIDGLRKTLQDGQPFPSDFRVRDKAGRIHWFEEMSTLARDRTGKIIGLSGVLRDITDRKMAEEQVRISEEKFRTLAEESPNMIFINKGGKVVYVNRACEVVMGLPRERFCSPDFDFLSTIADEHKDMIMERYRRHMERGEESGPVEVGIITGKRVRIEVILSARLINYEGGRAILGIMTDITERKKAEATLVKQQERLRQLAARLARAQDAEQQRIAEGLHDDVAQILVACSLKLSLARKAQDRDEMARQLEDVAKTLSDANGRVRLLSFELSTSTLHSLGLRDALRELCKSMEERYGIKLEIHEEGPVVELDDATATVLFKSARELLFNVVKHAGANEAHVSIGMERNQIVLTVEDNGRGFTSPVHDEDFSPAEGFGLFGIKERLLDLDGKMEIESEPERYTKVVIKAPLP